MKIPKADLPALAPILITHLAHLRGEPDLRTEHAKEAEAWWISKWIIGRAPGPFPGTDESEAQPSDGGASNTERSDVSKGEA